METVNSLTDDSSWDEVLEASEQVWDERERRLGLEAFPSPLEIAQRAERIYDQRYKRDYESRYFGKFVAIDIDSERCYLGSTPREAFLEALRASPGASLFLVKVGFEAAYELQGRYRRGCCNGIH